MSKKILHTGKWLSMGEVDTTFPSGKRLSWEFVTRSGSTEGAVCIIALNKQASPTSIVLVKQFRPPIEAEILELPAGLVEAGQSPADAALRELREETGYLGTVISEGPPIFNTPGMTDEYVRCLIVEVGEQLAQATEDDEEIEVIELPIKNLKQQLMQLEAEGLRMDAKLWSFAEGLALQQHLNA